MHFVILHTQAFMLYIFGIFEKFVRIEKLFNVGDDCSSNNIFYLVKSILFLRTNEEEKKIDEYS